MSKYSELHTEMVHGAPPDLPMLNLNPIDNDGLLRLVNAITVLTKKLVSLQGVIDFWGWFHSAVYPIFGGGLDNKIGRFHYAV